MKCSKKQGASLILGDEAYRQDVDEDQRLGEYFREHYDLWHNFAVAHGRDVAPPGLRFVTGCDKTSDWACAAWCTGISSAEMKFFASATGVLDGHISLWGRWESRQSPDNNVGPRRLVPPAFQSMPSYVASVIYLPMLFIFNTIMFILNMIWLPPPQNTPSSPDPSPRSSFQPMCLLAKLLHGR